jgi:hypothetical protein
MLVTVESTGISPRSVPDMVAWCQSGPSRAHWPGVQRISWDDTTSVPRLFYEVALAAPGAPAGRASVEEHMCRSEADDDGLFFESSQLWNWYGQVVSGAWATYRFVEHPSGTELRYLFRYILADLGALGVFDRDQFTQSIEGAVNRYVGALVAAGSADHVTADVTETAAGRRRRWLWAPRVP